LKTKELKLIVHIATDEKFIDTAHSIYEKAFPGMNYFLILQEQGNKDIKYLKKKDTYFFVKTNENFITKVEQFCEYSKVIVFHGMNYYQALIVHKLFKNSKKYVWSVFGGEIYNNNLIIKNESVGPKTYRQFVFNYKKWIKNILRPAHYLLFKGKENPNSIVKKSFRKMDYTAILFQEEVNNYVKLGIINHTIKQLNFTYYPLDLVIKKNDDFVKGNNILLGNSASYTNNHLEMFDILKNFELSNYQLITVLSYGNNEYAKNIINLGNEIFGYKFKPLTEFLPQEEYQKILKECGIVIMNHHRQQAVGNVMNAIYLGAKVYLSEKNTLFHYLKRIGCHIFSVEHDLIVENKEVFNLLTIEQMNHNRATVSSELSLDKVVNELRDIFTPILKVD
jgi:dTDP-N-acetylfucosamine:lipid II N-acetylfucosaminyltransferase